METTRGRTGRDFPYAEALVVCVHCRLTTGADGGIELFRLSEQPSAGKLDADGHGNAGPDLESVPR